MKLMNVLIIAAVLLSLFLTGCSERVLEPNVFYSGSFVEVSYGKRTTCIALENEYGIQTKCWPGKFTELEEILIVDLVYTCKANVEAIEFRGIAITLLEIEDVNGTIVWRR